MNKTLTFLLCILSLGAQACGPNNPDEPKPTPAPTEMSLSQSTFDAGKDGASFDLTVTSPSRPSVGVLPNWISIPDGTYNSETYKIVYKVTVAANPTTEERSYTVTFKAGTLSKDLIVKQAAQEVQDDTPKTLTLDKHAATMKQAGGTASVIITAPVAGTVSGVPAWLEASQTEFKNYKMKFSFKALANDSFEERSAEITITCGALSDKFTVTQEAKEKEPDLPDNDAVAMARKLGFGWNIGNQLEAHSNGMPSETAWTGVLCTQETFDAVAAAGLTSVRIPVSWMKLIGAAPDYTLDATRLARLKEVVGYAHKAGLITIINIHHDGADSEYWLSVKPGADNDAILAEIDKVWTQLANAFKEEGDWLIFESFNEIHDGGWGNSSEYQTAEGKKRQNDILNGWNQKFVDVVRATGGNNATRWLGVPGYAASPEKTLNDGFVLPADKANRIMVGVHEYTPYHFCQTAEANEWGHTRKTNLGDPSYDESYMRDIFKKLYNKWVANNVPVYLGEFGCANRTVKKQFDFQLYWYEYMAKCARTYGLSGFVWDNGAVGSGKEVYGIFHHGTGAYLDEERGPKIVEVLKKGFTSTDSDYTLQSVYESAPQN